MTSLIIWRIWAEVRASGGGIDFEIRSGVVHQVHTDAAKIVFTVSGPCAIFLQAADREDRANRVETNLKECIITITKEAFERSGEASVMTWAKCQTTAKALAGKTAFMQLAGGATLDHSRLTSIRVSGACIFRQASPPSPANKGDISVLYVEGRHRAWEPKFIRWALGQEPSIRLFESVRSNDAPGPDADLFQLDKHHYDVIIIGDITARRFTAGNPRILSTIERLVTEKGIGLMMLGGYESFGNSDWQNSDLAHILPVQLNVAGQLDEPVQMVPTLEGLRHYVLRLASNPADNRVLWSKLPKLDGMTRLGGPKLGAVVLAKSQSGEPLLVGEPSHGLGRTLAFGADTTWCWRRTSEGVRAHARFWQQVVFWLAKHDQPGP